MLAVLAPLSVVDAPRLLAHAAPVAVPAGFPSPAQDYYGGPVDLNEHLIKDPVSTFIVRVSGDSMIGPGSTTVTRSWSTARSAPGPGTSSSPSSTPSSRSSGSTRDAAASCSAPRIRPTRISRLPRVRRSRSGVW